MRGIIYFLSVVSVVCLAYWAYHEGYQTRQTAREVARLQSDLGAAHEKLSVLRAEWAYLNRPDRLRALHEMNFERLGLMELSAEQFGTVTQIGYPPAAAPKAVGDPLAGLDPSTAIDTIGSIESMVGTLPPATMIQPAPYQPEPEALP